VLVLEEFYLIFERQLVCGISYPAEDLEALMKKESKTVESNPGKKDGMEVQMEKDPSTSKAGEEKEGVTKNDTEQSADMEAE